MRSNTLYEAKVLLKEGKHDDARQLLITYLKHNENSAEAWWMLSYAIEDKGQQKDCIKRVLSLKENYEPALARLEKLNNPVDSSQESVGKPRKTRVAPKKKPKLSGGIIALVIVFFCLAIAGIGYFGLLIIKTTLKTTSTPSLPQVMMATQMKKSSRSLPPTWTPTPSITSPATRTPLPGASATKTPPILATFTEPPRIEGVSMGDYAPDFTLSDTDGNTISLSNYEGQTVMVVFWATWCPYCVQEIPAINAVYEKYKEQGLVVLGVNAGEQSDKVSKYQNSHNISYPILLDTKGTIQNRYRVSGIPAHFVINANGKIIYVGTGGFNKSALEQNVKIWLADRTR